MQTTHRHLLPAALALLLLGAASAQANIVIDHSDIALVPTYSQATMDAIAASTFYFEHASVGGNMVDGLQTLHDTNASFYRLTTSAVAEAAYGVSSPPSAIVAGTVYEFARGNPDWPYKIDWFSANIVNTWGGKTTFALNKFCWIDQGADWATYRDSMVALEAANRGTRFVYMTMPLNTDADSDNVLRNRFNSALRLWASDNNKILFDIADIEAHDADGVSQTFTYEGATYYRMADEWTTPEDGGHLIRNNSDQRVALGFYALAAEATAIPEPATYAACFGLATLVLAFWRRRAAHRQP
jgi:hypothetical protein